MEASGNSYNKLGKKKRVLVDFFCAVLVMVIYCRRRRGLLIAQCTSKPNIVYLVMCAGSRLSVMMVEWCAFALRRLMQGTILTLAWTSQNLLYFAVLRLVCLIFTFCQAGFLMANPLCSIGQPLFWVNEFAMPRQTSTCFANSMSPVYSVWDAKLCSFLNKCVEFQESLAQVFSYLFILLPLFLFVFFFAPLWWFQNGRVSPKRVALFP